MTGNFKNVHAKAAADADYIGDLHGEAGIYFGARISPAEIERRLLALGVESGTQIGSYRAGITYPDLSAMPSTVEAAEDQITATILKSRDPGAVEALCEVFQIDIQYLAHQWLQLRQAYPAAANCLMEGRLRDALRLLPSDRWGHIGAQIETDADGVRAFLAEFVRVWVANDLQIAAEAAQVKIYTPTGLPSIDGVDPTIAPKIDGVSKAIKDEVELFDKVIKVLGALAPGQKASKKQTVSFRNRGLDKQAREFLAQWLCEIRKDRSMSRADLENAIFSKLERGRRAVGQIAENVEEMRRKKPGSEKVTIHHGKWLYSLQTPNPLERLYMACRYAASWCELRRVPGGSRPQKRLWSEHTVDLVCGTHSSNSRRTARPSDPPDVSLDSESVRALFYIMRNAVVVDPTHLPEALGWIIETGTNKHILVRSNHEVRRRTGSTIPFLQIWRAFAKSTSSDSGQTSVADGLRPLLGPKKHKPAMIEAKLRSQGTILQRLS